MKNIECFAITTTNEKWISVIQESARDIFVVECDDILSADMIGSFKEACDMILELSGEKETIWEYSKTFKKKDLKLVKINMIYETMGMV